MDKQSTHRARFSASEREPLNTHFNTGLCTRTLLGSASQCLDHARSLVARAIPNVLRNDALYFQYFHTVLSTP